MTAHRYRVEVDGREFTARTFDCASTFPYPGATGETLAWFHTVADPLNVIGSWGDATKDATVTKLTQDGKPTRQWVIQSAWLTMWCGAEGSLTYEVVRLESYGTPKTLGATNMKVTYQQILVGRQLDTRITYCDSERYRQVITFRLEGDNNPGRAWQAVLWHDHRQPTSPDTEIEVHAVEPRSQTVTTWNPVTK